MRDVKFTTPDLGHSFLTHFLFTSVPWSIYHDDSATILGGVMEEMAANLSTLFWDGVSINSTRYYFALIGVKGDAEFHVECADLLRSYMTVGTANNLLMCPECDADDNFGDVSDHPAWLPTVAKRIHFILLELVPRNNICFCFLLSIPPTAS